MNNTRDTKLWIIILILVIIVIMLLVRYVIPRKMSENKQLHKTPGEIMLAHSRDRDDYQMFVGVPPKAPERWEKITHIDDIGIRTLDGKTIPLANITAYVVAYPRGTLLESQMMDLPMPKGIRGWGSTGKTSSDLLQLSDLKEGKKYVRIEFGASTRKPDNINHYSTTLINISNVDIRILKFGGYAKTRKGYLLSTVSGDIFSAEDFCQWYGVNSDGWIEPGESATDLNNYGGVGSLWAYYCQIKDGREFICGKIYKGKKQ